jgi:hypothetical protein
VEKSISIIGDLPDVKETAYRDGQVVAASQLSDLASVAERGTHDDGLVAVLLVVVEDALDAGNTRVVLLGVLLLGGGLVPVEDTADERGDEEGTGLSGSDGLDEGEHEGQVAVDAVVALQNLGGLDTLPCRGDLDENCLTVSAKSFSSVRIVPASGAGQQEESKWTYPGPWRCPQPRRAVESVSICCKPDLRENVP